MKLGVNVDHVATLREARKGLEPDPVEAAILVQKTGADSIVAHLREDRRHINERDIRHIKNVLDIKFNMEMSIAEDIVRVALDVQPAEVTIVPERRQEVTTEAGLDAIKYRAQLSEVISEFKKKGITVSLFLDPELEQIETARKLEADYVELHTGRYARAFEEGDYQTELGFLVKATEFARSIGLKVNAGHGLNYKNVPEIVQISEIETLNIGHSIMSRALFVGIRQAVTEMLQLLG